MSNDFKQVLEARTQVRREDRLICDIPPLVVEFERTKNASRQFLPEHRRILVVFRSTDYQRYALTLFWLALISLVSLGRPSVLFRDDHRATNGGDAVLDLGTDGTFNSSMKQQLQVIDETVRLLFAIPMVSIEGSLLGYVSSESLRSHAEHWTNHRGTRRYLYSIGHHGSTTGRTCAPVSSIGIGRWKECLRFRIDANVDDATHHIEGAHTELLKYLRSVTSNRWLIIKVFAVLIIFFLIFIVFLAWKRCPSRKANNAHINIFLSLSPG